MSIDRSLRSAGRLTKHRNVLTRAERVEHLVQAGKFDMETDDPMGLPKVGNRKVIVASKATKKRDEAGTEGEQAEAETEAK
jgi:small basic protein (TIGR04137 family)